MSKPFSELPLSPFFSEEVTTYLSHHTTLHTNHILTYLREHLELPPLSTSPHLSMHSPEEAKLLLTYITAITSDIFERAASPSATLRECLLGSLLYLGYYTLYTLARQQHLSPLPPPKGTDAPPSP